MVGSEEPLVAAAGYDYLDSVYVGNLWSRGPSPHTGNKRLWPCDIGQFHDFYHNTHMHPALEGSDLVLAFCTVAASGAVGSDTSFLE